ncbi:MAG: hypothetical protein ABIR30_12415 [Chitinophagaceae bacterium]
MGTKIMGIKTLNVVEGAFDSLLFIKGIFICGVSGVEILFKPSYQLIGKPGIEGAIFAFKYIHVVQFLRHVRVNHV